MRATKSVFDMYDVRVEVRGNNGRWKKCMTGTVDKYSKEAKECAEKGQVVVSDAISANRIAFPIDSELYRFVSLDFTEALKYLETALEKAQKKSDSVEGFGKGKLFSVPVADGCAYYVVTRVTKKTATVEWRGFHPDRWSDHVLRGGGTFPREAIERLVGREDSLRAFFSRK